MKEMCSTCRFMKRVFERVANKTMLRLVCSANNFNNVSSCWTCPKYKPKKEAKKKWGFYDAEGEARNV